MARRLTPDLISTSPAVYNPLGERMLDLRSLKLLVIENLDEAEDEFDAIDICDNNIKKLANFPRMFRLRSLYIANNNISKIDTEIGKALMNLSFLQLSNNRISKLSDVGALASLGNLKELSLIDNPVTQRPHYRLYVAATLPHLRVLDFQRITQKERIAASALFSSSSGKSLLKKIKDNQDTATISMSVEGEKSSPTPQQLAALRDAVESAKSTEELDKLEHLASLGIFPATKDESVDEKAQNVVATEQVVQLAKATSKVGTKSAQNKVTGNTKSSPRKQKQNRSSKDEEKLKTSPSPKRTSKRKRAASTEKASASPKQTSTRKRATSTDKTKSSPKRTSKRKRAASTKKASASPKRTSTRKRAASTEKASASPKRTSTRKRAASTEKASASPKRTSTRKRAASTESLRQTPSKKKKTGKKDSERKKSFKERMKELMKLKAVQLREMCSSFGLDQKGKKSILCSRLIERESKL
eukprot:g2853.t1